MVPAGEEIGPASAASMGALASSARPRLRDYLHLTKARLSLTVVLSSVVGYWLGAADIDPAHLLWFTAGTLLVVGGANAWNQVLERELDALMARTAQRPLPSGRMAVGQAVLAASLASTAGLAILFLQSGWIAGTLGFLGLLVYVLAYTPMKRRSSWSTATGAVSGALPTLMGFGAAAGGLAPAAFCLFGVVFFWQFPHTWAIAATYREDYERVGYRALPRKGITAATILATLALLGTSLLPAILGVASAFYAAGALGLGALFLVSAVRFGDGSERPRAAALLAMSLFYLPLMLALAAFGGGSPS